MFGPHADNSRSRVSKNYERWDTNDDILPVYVFFRLPCIIVFEVCCLCSTLTPSSKVASGEKVDNDEGDLWSAFEEVDATPKGR
jgi:hypothetical protein